MYLRSVVLIAVAIFPVAAFAATVSPIGGDVRVSTGQGFQKIVAPTEFAPGAQVMVSPGGTATIAYANDCVVQVKPASVVAVTTWSPCKALPEPMHFTPKVGEEKKTSAQESPAPEPPSPPPPPPAEETAAEQGGSNFGNYCLIGGVVVGAGALAAILLSQNNDHSASP